MPQPNAAAVFGVPHADATYDSLVRATPDLFLYWSGFLVPILSSISNFALPAQWSMEIWAKWTTVASNRGILSVWSTNGVMLWVATDSKLKLHVNAADIDSGMIPTAGQWYHIVGTYDGTSRAIYINGNLMGGPTSGVTPAAVSTPLITHNYLGSSQPNLAATLYDAAIYSRALTAGEVSQHYVVGANRPLL